MEVCCPKAVYFGMGKIPEDIASVMIQVPLSGSATKVRDLEDEGFNQLAAEIQGKMLSYRLANYSRIRISDCHGTNFTHQIREITTNLAACIVDDTKLAGQVAPLLNGQDNLVRGRGDQRLDAAIVGAILAVLHEKKLDRVRVKEITALANSLLRTQGEIVEYSPEEVGHRLDGFSLWRTRQKEGMFLLLGRDTSRLVHRLALGYGVSWDPNSAEGCEDCQLLREPTNPRVV